MKAAIVHDWLTGMRGGEKCLEVFCELLPNADIYTLLHKPGTVSPTIESHRIHTSFVQRLPFPFQLYRHYLPIFPLAAASTRIKDVDLVLSSSHCVAKNVRAPEGACHMAYLHTPMRYVWDQYRHYFGPGRARFPVRTAMGVLRPWLQRIDVRTSHGVHYFAANSRHVAARIRRYYGREARVIHPPVDVERFQVSEADEGYYLMVTAFAPYKRVDLAIGAFNVLGLPLRIIGSGQDAARLKRMAGRNIEFFGWGADSDIERAYAGCRALIFPGEEDFGIVPVEAMASGKPAIAFGKGGVLETVVGLDRNSADRTVGADVDVAAPTGIFFQEQTVDSLVDAVRRFERVRDRFEPAAIRRRAEAFGRRRFSAEISGFIQSSYSEFCSGRARES